MQSGSPSVVGIVGLAGAVSQTGGLALLVVLFLSLREHAKRTSFFPRWKSAWIAALVALVAVTLRYSPLPSLRGIAFWSLSEADPQVRILYVTYQAAKVLFLALVVTGAHTLVRGWVGLPSTRRLVVASLALGTASVAFTPTLNGVLFLQACLAVPSFLYAAYLLVTLPRARRSWGSVSLSIALAAHVALWTAYGFGFAYSVWVDPVETHNPLHLLLTYNSFVDLFAGMLLGFSMVNLLMEDAARVIAAAHGELGAAHDQLRRQALFDAMTGALNRRAFGEGVGLERVRASFGTVAMIDVDNLKPVNDTHGHAVGDALLRHLVDALIGGLRTTDKVYRWGGDEFLVLMPTASEGNALERISVLVRGIPPLQEGSLSVPLRASIGVAPYSSAERLLDAVARADRAMYEAKARQRERRQIAGIPLVAEAS
jgi:diguanylate cyclase (GGDEF)-like protein